ncbi:uncharacterized protein LOC125858970 [Solanum stenotomum]|uniref:uncharacterized protein LOC125858970 n=1 Tax=Solanum stenotomum TaxID=172797 RepID=UPI0020D0E24F|nr:uncharacterized protein LOC125858970 [Solanum stenotomum]
MPTLATRPSGTSNSTSSKASSTFAAPSPPRSAAASASRPPITQAMLYKMGHLAQFADVCASRLEVVVPRMIERAIDAVFTPLKALIDALTTRVEVFERGHGASEEVTALKADVSELRKDVDHLKSIDFTSLFGTMKIPDDPSIDILAYSEVPTATTGDEVRVDVVVAETDEEQFGVHEDVVFDDLADLESAMVDSAVQASLRDVSIVGSSGAMITETPSTNAHTDGATDMQISPRLSLLG